MNASTESADAQMTPDAERLTLEAIYEMEGLLALLADGLSKVIREVEVDDTARLYVLRGMVVRAATLNGAVMSAISQDTIYIKNELLAEVRGRLPASLH